MIIVITGATGTGKSELAIALAQKIGGEIVNADAFQAYQELKISTAAPSEEMKKIVPHHLYDYVPLTEAYDIHKYQKDARFVIENLKNAGKTPILVGGSGLYIRAALYDYDLSLDTSNVDLTKYDSYSNEDLHEELRRLDPDEAEKIPYQNRVRVLRAIAICLASGTSKTELIAKQNHEPIEKTLFFVLKKDREDLYPKLDKRVDLMVEQGLENEVVTLIKKYVEGMPAFRAIGVKEFIPYVHGDIDLETAINKVKADTRHYVKRQETFFRHQFPVIEVSSLEEILEAIKNG